MLGFFELRLDFIYFLHGLALALLASSAWGLSHLENRRTWNWLAIFGATQASFFWLKAVICDFGDSQLLSIFRVLLLAFSFHCLLQFARRKLFAMGILLINRWSHFAPAALLVIGLYLFGENFTVWYMPLLGIGSAALGGISLVARARGTRRKPEAQRLKLCGIALTACVSMTGMFAARPDYIPQTTELNTSLYALASTAGSALLAAIACWMFGYHYSLLHHARLSEQNASVWSRKRTIQSTLVIGIIIAGWFSSEYAVKAKDKDMRGDVLLRAHLVGASVPPEHIASLKWDNSDLGNPHYVEIKKRMMALVKTNKDMRFVMITGLHEGKAYFLADSERPDSPDYSPPGEYYAEAPAEYLQASARHAPFVLGPIVDHWGIWITASVPIGEFGPEKRWVMAEIDITANNWSSMLRAARLPPIFITLLITLLFITYFYAQDRIYESMARLTATENRTSTLVEGSPNCVQMFDPNGICTTINQNGLNALDRRRDEVIGKHFASIWPSQRQKTVQDALAFTLTGHSTVFESEYERPDGVIIIWRVALTPVMDEQRRIRSLVAIGVDISDLKKTEKDLLTAKDAAEAANRTKSEFLAVMSHEIRTPLGGVIGMLNVLRKHPMDPEQQLYTELAHENAENLLGMLDDILDAAKVEAGKLTLECIPFDPSLEFGRVLEPMRIRAEAKGLDFGWTLSPELPRVLHGDPTRLRQVLANLLSNALKFTEQGAITTTISATPTTPGYVNLSIDVKDTGIGIGEEQLARLFAKFEQADSSTTRKFGGTGLGLSIVKSLAELMNGEIVVHSTPGEGATFSFTARLNLGSAADLITRRNSAAPLTNLPRHRAKLHILCAEDDLTNQVAAEFLVKQMGHTIEFVDDGEKAIDWLTCNRADVVLMDNRMPVLDGFQATRLIREPSTITLDHDIYIIANTANAGSGYRERCLDAGMNDYLTKPLRENELHAALEKAIKHLEKRGIPLQPPPDNQTRHHFAASAETCPPAGASHNQPGLSEDELLAILDEAEAKPPTPPQLPPEAIERITEQYYIEAPLRLSELRQSLASSDIVSLARAAHSLKGTSRYVQADALSSICAEIEKLADRNKLDHVSELISRAETEYASLLNQRKPASPPLAS